MCKRNYGFTIIELMVVILIIGILASVSVPMMKARVDRSKWSEACTTAGAIRSAVRNFAAETSVSTAKLLIDAKLSDAPTQNALGFVSDDLEGVYFSAGDYTINSVNNYGIASIKVTGSKGDAPSGSYLLQEDGKWVVQ